MADSSRRKFLALTGAGAAAATAAVALPAADAEAATPAAKTAGPLIAYVKNAKTGDLVVMIGEREVHVRDKDLAARIANVVTS